jgi:hypothetical protein
MKVSSFTLWSLYTLKKGHNAYCTDGRVGPRAVLDTVVKGKSLVMSESNPGHFSGNEKQQLYSMNAHAHDMHKQCQNVLIITAVGSY